MLALLSLASASTLYLGDYNGDVTALHIPTYDATPVGRSGLQPQWGGLAYDPTTATMWISAGLTNKLYSVDPYKFDLTDVGSYGVPDVFSLAAWGGQLYGLQANATSGLWSIDPHTAAATWIGAPYLPYNAGYAGVGGADTDATGQIIANASHSGHLYRINPATAEATYLGTAGVGVTENGLAVDHDTGNIYLATEGGWVYEVRPDEGYAAYLVYYGNSFASATIIPDDVGNLLASKLGACRVALTLDVFGATPSGDVALLTSRAGAGATRVPSGPCAGTVLPLASPRLAAQRTANGIGAVSLSVTTTAAQCGTVWMALDLTTCELSNVSTL